MGNILHVSEETVKSHKVHIANKLKTHNFTHAVATVALLTPHLITDAEAQVE